MATADMTSTEAWTGSFILVHLFLILGVVLGMIAIVHMLQQRRSPQSIVAWLLAIIICPWIVVPLYLLLGGRKHRRRAADKEDLTICGAGEVMGKDVSRIDRLIRSYSLPGAMGGNEVELLGTGVEIYNAMVQEIDRATSSICIETFVLHLDDVGTAIVDRLTQRAREGIAVLLLIDGLGSLSTSKHKLARLIKAGGKVSHFMPVIHNPFRGSGNLRDHRKIAIFDDAVVISGGTNIAQEYIGPTPSTSRWKDCSVRITGPAVHTYIETFSSDWRFSSGEKYAGSYSSTAMADGQTVQVVPSGPDVPGDPLYDAIMSMTYLATDRIWLVTPYFVPDDALCTALAAAARRGTQVHILVPDHSNHGLADWARGTYLRECQEAGATILRYMPGMVHGKVMLMDDELAIVGSANLDMRSLFLNYESAMLMYSQKGIKDVESWINGLAKECETGVKPVSHLRGVGEGIARMFGPLL
jgi:cardiolipin synthase